MDFALTDDQQAIRDTAQRFADERLAPHYLDRTKTGRIERELIRDMGALGLIGADLPESVGGLGLGSVTGGVIMEDIARGDFNVAYVQLLGSLNGWIIANHAAPDIAADVVPKICSGDLLVALGLTEPGGGSDAANLQLRADGTESGWLLNGEKTSISLADQSDLVILFARTGEPDSRARGVSAFLVPLDAPGVTCTRFDDVGSESVGRGSIFFENVEIPRGSLLASENQGFRTVMVGFDYSRALIGLQVLAAADASLREAWDYAVQRQAFGQSIVRNQGVSEPLAEAETWLEAAKLLCYKTLWLRDQDKPHTTEAAMCKWWAPKTAFDIIHRCLLTHGHLGYSKDMAVQQRLRDVLGLQIGDGTAQIQKMVIAREMVGRDAIG
ncbi:MAG: acyl-CoA dehydrogenase family protein [Pseudomonadota bacterium]